jgi:endoglucanase
VTAAILALTGCAHRPDTRLHPQAPQVAYAPLRHPFAGARLYHDPTMAATRWQATHGAAWLAPITSQPQAHWLTGPRDLAALPTLARKARLQHALLVLVAYYLPNRDCTQFTQGAPTDGAYDAWIGQLIDDLAGTRAVVILEPDAVSATCFDAARAAVLRRSILRLEDAGQDVYLDAGHPRWRPTGEMAVRLIESGIQYAEGFSVNVSNRFSTDESYRWGRELSDLVGDRDFVIDTSRNGLGPPPGGAWCNPPDQALGEAPSTDPNRPGLAALLWIKPPGESDGPCGGEHTYLFSPTQARNLILNSPAVSLAHHRSAGGPRS